MEQDTLEQLYRKYYPGTMLYCITLCGNFHLAEDLVADAFVKAYLSLPQDAPSFPYWLCRVCKNLWIDHCRRNKYETPSEVPESAADFRTPEQIFLQKEQHRALWEAIHALSPPDRELLVLHYFSGLPLKEIAAITGKSHAAIRQRMVRLRAALKKEMEEQGYGST